MEKSIEFHGKQIWYDTVGEGFPLVLLHGYLESKEIWDGFSDELAGRFQVIRVDLPGHGRSEVLGDVHTMEILAAAVKEVVEREVSGKKIVLIGHSLGGYVTLAFAEEYATLLGGFSLFHSHPLADTEEVKVNRQREIALIAAGKKEMIYSVNVPKAFAEENVERFHEEVERAIAIAKRTPDEGIQAMLRGMMQRPDRRHLLEKATLPVLWILGKGDRYISLEKMEKEVHPGEKVTRVVLEHSGHMGFIEERERTLELISRFAENVWPVEG